MVKPFDPLELVTMVRRLLEMRKAGEGSEGK